MVWLGMVKRGFLSSVHCRINYSALFISLCHWVTAEITGQVLSSYIWPGISWMNQNTACASDKLMRVLGYSVMVKALLWMLREAVLTTKAPALLLVAHVCFWMCVYVLATLLWMLSVFREEWCVRWKQTGLGFMKSINHSDSTTLYLSALSLCHRKFWVSSLWILGLNV